MKLNHTARAPIRSLDQLNPARPWADCRIGEHSPGLPKAVIELLDVRRCVSSCRL